MIHYREYLLFGLKLKKKKNRLEYISQILIYISPYSSRNLSGCHKVSVKKKHRIIAFESAVNRRWNKRASRMFQPREPGKDFHPGDRRRRRGIDASLSYIRAQMSECSSSLSFFPSFFPFFFFNRPEKKNLFTAEGGKPRRDLA